jgi:hypothetical protein
MLRRARIVIVVVLIAAAAWLALTIVDAVTRSDGVGGVFWGAVGLLAVLAAALPWLAARIARIRPRR